MEAGQVVRGMFACVLPGMISFLCGFYCVLHAWLNAFAEMLTFADRLFYEVIRDIEKDDLQLKKAILLPTTTEFIPT